MENLYCAVIPAQAGIPWLLVLGDPRFRGDDGFAGMTAYWISGTVSDTPLADIARARERPRQSPSILAAREKGVRNLFQDGGTLSSWPGWMYSPGWRLFSLRSASVGTPYSLPIS